LPGAGAQICVVEPQYDSRRGWGGDFERGIDGCEEYSWLGKYIPAAAKAAPNPPLVRHG
jgi:hypothetical protein